MTKINLRAAVSFAGVAAALLLLASTARAANVVAAAPLGANGQPFPQSKVAVLSETGEVAATGKTDDKGRVCIAAEALAAGKVYRICVRPADQSAGPCTTAVAAATDCAAALASLGAGGTAPALAPALAPAAAASGATTKGLVATGVGAATGGAMGIGISQGAGGGAAGGTAAGSGGEGTQPFAPAVVPPSASKKK